MPPADHEATSQFDNDPSIKDGLVVIVPTEGTDMSANWSERLSRLQQGAVFLSHVLALIAIVLVTWWVQLLGGLSWNSGEAKRTFNYHPLMMVIAFTFMTVASLSFRYPFLRYQNKLTHALSWSIATLCGIIALVAVFQSHNDLQSGFIANMYSMHSWIGIVVVIVYLSQWLVGIYAFGLGNPSWRGVAILVHKYVGPIIYQGVAVVMVLGIQEKEGFVGCAYEVDKVDSFPIQHFYDIPTACRVSHFLGIVILIMALSTSFAIQTFGAKQAQDIHVA